MKIIKNSLKMRNPSTTEFESINGFVGESGVHVGPNAPLGSGVDLWINSSDTSSFNLPEIKDGEINETDTWSSNKISNTKSYSTEEQFTGGYWIDGKPIYKKVITGTLSQASANITLTTLEELESLVNISGYLIPSTKTDHFTPINCYYNSSYYFTVWMEGNPKTIATNASFTGNYTLIVEYTKIEATEEV